MLDCIKVPQAIYFLCEQQSLLLGKTLDECVVEVLTDWLEVQTGNTMSELLGDEEPNDEHLMTPMAKTA